MDLDKIWQAVLGEIEISLSKATFTTWFKNTFIISFEDNCLTIGVPHTFTKTWLENRYFKEISTAFHNSTKETLKEIKYIISIKSNNTQASSQSTEKTIKPLHNNNSIISNCEKPINNPPLEVSLATISRCGLNPKYNFSNFVVGKGNELAYAACQAVATNPGQAYNPLFIYGGVGLGKTHMMQAIGNELLKKTTKIVYASSEKFTNEYIEQIKSGQGKNLKEKYRNVDVLLIDDIQFMGGKEGTQQEFFHTFNELHQANKQIVITSDRPPKAIPGLEKRLLSRFEWGMIADVTQPDLETRIAILKNKCQEKNCHLSDEIINFLAQNILNNVRELEGALTRLITYYEFNKSEPSLESAKQVLASLLSEFQESSLTAKSIIDGVAKFYNISVKDLIGRSRKKELVTPRQITMYLMRKDLDASFPNIGSELGGKDHTTVIYACNKVEQELQSNFKLSQDINSIRQLIKS